MCRTIRRDVRAVSTYAALGKEYSVPTISRTPSVSIVPPEGFRQMREVAKKAAEEEREAKEATIAAVGGGQAYLLTTTNGEGRTGRARGEKA